MKPKAKPSIPKLFQSIIENDAKLQETLDAKVIPMVEATGMIQRKRRLIKYAADIYEGDPERHKK